MRGCPVRDLLWQQVRKRSAGPVGCRQGAQGGLQDRRGGEPRRFHSFAIGSFPRARSLSWVEAARWIVCQPRTLTVVVPGNPLSGPPGFSGGAAQDLGQGRGRIIRRGLAPVCARKDFHGG
jgi:hypothetical protein